ncbi:MAG: hypothetical protein ACRDQ5_02265 [Sciscionella sp.]
MTNTLYSQADRCHECKGRAVLTQESAQHFAAVTARRLQAFACPAGRGWHVWAPDIEIARPNPMN